MTRFRSKSTVLPKPWQRGTGAEGIVEAEQARLRLAAGPMAALALVGAGEAVARARGGLIARELLRR